MKFPRSSIPLLAFCVVTVGCSDAVPTEVHKESPPPVFAVSESKASAIDHALADLRDRVLPALDQQLLNSGLIQLQSAWSGRDPVALRRALIQTDAALSSAAEGESAASAAAELDVIRMVLLEARPFADVIPRSKR